MSTHPSIKQINKPIDAGIVQRKKPRRNEKIFVLKVDCPSWVHEVLSVFSTTCMRVTVKTVVIRAIVKWLRGLYSCPKNVSLR
jgi:hypothetical protein